MSSPENLVPLRTRSTEIQDLLERSTEKTKVTLVMEDHEAMEGVETENQNMSGKGEESDVIMESQEVNMMNHATYNTSASVSYRNMLLGVD